MKKNFLVIAFCILAASLGVANEQDSGQDRDVIERAKSKKYVNGAEEGELRVQAQVFKPQRKIAPVIDKKETDSNLEHD